MPWPQRILDRLGRAPTVGDWVMPCCIQDLHRVEDQEEIEAVLEFIEEDFDDGGIWWPSLDAALAEILPKKLDFSPKWGELEDNIVERLRREEYVRSSPLRHAAGLLTKDAKE